MQNKSSVTKKLSFTGWYLAYVLLIPAFSQAQTAWPSQPVKIVVPWTTGGAVDMGARVIGQKIAEQTGQSVTVENKPGASSTIGFS